MKELSPLNICLPYLLIIFLSSSDSTFDSFLHEADFKTGHFVYIENEKVPRVILDFVLSDTKDSNITLIYLAHMFANEAVDTVFKRNFLHFILSFDQDLQTFGFLHLPYHKSSVGTYFDKFQLTGYCEILYTDRYCF